MPKIDNYTRSLLLFQDRENPLKDECNNQWNLVTGTVEIVDVNEEGFSKAAYFNKAYIEMIPDFILGGEDDFTIEMYFKTESTSIGDSLYSITSTASGNQYGIGTFYHSGANYTLEYWGSLNSTSPIYYHPTHQEFQQKFCHYALEYSSKEHKMYCLLNGKVVDKDSSMNIPAFIPNKIYVGHHHWSYVPYFTGWIFYFKISACLRWKEDYTIDLNDIIIFDTKRNVIKNIEINNDLERHIKTWNRNIYAFVTSDRHRLIKNNKTQKQMINS